jgi:hypothetical protein
MRRKVQLLLWVVSFTVCAVAQEKVVDNFHRETDKVSDASSSSRQARYLDARERKAATLTFKWRSVREAARKLQRDGERPVEVSEDVVELDAERVLIPDLTGTYTILRTPNRSCIRAQRQVPVLGSNTAGKSERPLRWDYYYLGDSGEIVISVFWGLSDGDTDPGLVHLGYAGRSGGFGLPSPFVGPLAGEMIFLGGISPFRLLGAELSDWKLVEVNEDEWVFELRVEEESRKRHFEGLLLSGEQVRFHLSRRHGDAPLRLEFRSGKGYEKWETTAFSQVQGIWMPQTVICETSLGETFERTLYELESVSQTVAVEISIPWRSSVRDWRPLGLQLWRVRDEEKSIETEWSPELLRSIMSFLSNQGSSNR